MGASETRALLREFLRVGKTFPDYNIRNYIRRRALDGFKEHASLTDPAAAQTAFQQGQESLTLAKRQAVVYGLYERPFKNIVELQGTSGSK